MWACPLGDGTYNILNPSDFSVILASVQKECVDLFGDVTYKEEGGCGHSATPTTGPCALPKGSLYIMCPPSNGITANYFLPAKSAAYEQNMTTQSPECADQENVIKVDASSPYCGGGGVDGPGDAYPDLVACIRTSGQQGTIVDLFNGPDHAPLEKNVPVQDIPRLYPGRRWMLATDQRCSALPDFSQYGQTPIPTPTPTPTPMPTPTPTPTPMPTPSPTPTPGEEPTGRAVIVIMPPPMAQPSPCDAGTWLRQRPAAAGAAQFQAGPSGSVLGRVRLRRGLF